MAVQKDVMPLGLSSDKGKESNMDELKDAILEYVIGEYADEDDKITFDTPLISSGLVDSFSMVSLKRFLEVRYKISIPDEDASPEAFDSVNKIADLVRRYTS
jgi:acyl carrier protein/D-alanine--poly(phosphoribitol) ligase subunit 2